MIKQSFIGSSVTYDLHHWHRCQPSRAIHRKKCKSLKQKRVLIPIFEIKQIFILNIYLKLYLKVHMLESFLYVFHNFLASFITDKAEAQHFKNFVKISVKSKNITGFSRIPHYRRKRTVSLHVFASSLNTLYTAESAQFHSTFSLTTISLTPHFRRKREV
jgi:hypothetical protein